METDLMILTGQTRRHLSIPGIDNPLDKPVHKDALQSFLDLKESAAAAGFDIQINSAFRSFEDQLLIWNRKVQGLRPVLDMESNPICIEDLSPWELAQAILRWSALPGASRHHWGTDIDVYDALKRPPGYDIQLIPEEVADEGMFGPFHMWLDQQIIEGRSFGFFRPYEWDKGGVAPERWHLSYGPLSKPFLENLTPDALREVIEKSPILLKDTILENLNQIYEKYVININQDESKEWNHGNATT